MFDRGLPRLALYLFVSTIPLYCSVPSSCIERAQNYTPCELSFALQAGDLKPDASTYRDDLLRVEFRSPSSTTYMMYQFADDRQTLHVRFTPTETGKWAYRVSSSITRLDNQEGTFAVSDSPGRTGMVGVANLRHFWTTGKKPHLWFAAEAPFLQIDQGTFEQWLDNRKQDGYTHIRGIVLSHAGALKPMTEEGEPNPAYFAKLDERLLAAANRGFTLDLMLGDTATAAAMLKKRDQLEPMVRYITGRYAGLNVTWQGLQEFEATAGTRALLQDLAALLQKYDAYQHPRSTDARDSSSPLIADGWMNYLIEAVGDPQLGAVEHQFTEMPEIHVIQATEPDAFRHELWSASTNGEYPSVSYEALRNEQNVKAARTWFHVLSQTRHWELEPYFDVSGARAMGLDEVEYLAYAQTPGIVEITLPKHKYNPVWINPATGEEIPLKNYRGETFSQQTPDNSHDWVLTVPRDGEKESMAKYYYFESQDPPVQEVETDTAKAPFEVVEPAGDALSLSDPIKYSVKITRANRASRLMQYVWWGETVQGQGARLLGLGGSGSSTAMSKVATDAPNLNVRIEAINANGKAYEMDKVYELKP